MIPGSANPLLLADAGYQIQRSLRFRSGASAYLSRTPAATSNRTTWTWSGWVKRGVFGGQQALFAAYGSGSSFFTFGFDTSNALIVYDIQGATDYGYITSALFRDPSAWYHVVLCLDTTQAAAGNRVKLHINGTQHTLTQSYGDFPQNYQAVVNYTYPPRLGSNQDAGAYFDGYLSDINFIDGQALTPASFGEISPVTGQWQAKKYAGTYGTNGFYLPFTDNSAATAAAIGADNSGNGNNWTPSGISLTSGVTYDSMLDVPLGSGGGERGNYAVLNPLFKPAGTNPPAISEANLKAAPSAAAFQNTFSTIGASSGKCYAELVCSGTPNSANYFGVSSAEEVNYIATNSGSLVGSTSSGCGIRMQTGEKRLSNVNTSYGTGFVSGDIMQFALDLDTGKVYFGKNGTWFSSGDPVAGTNAALTGLSGTFFIGGSLYTDGFTSVTFNFGQRPFAYTPPTGFKALHTGNLPEPVIKQPAQYMAATAWTGDQAARTITNAVNGVGFQPDLVWSKSRSNIESHRFNDSVRGGNGTALYTLFPNETSAEDANTALTGFVFNGFTMAAGLTSPNVTGRTYVGWQWKAGGAAVANNAGSIASQVSAGVAQGFSIVTFTGTGAATTVGHGLGVVPKMVIVKARSNGTYSWSTYHASVGAGALVWLNLTNSSTASTAVWNNTSPTASVFSLGADLGVNQSGQTYVAYCFSEVAGYSKFGSYVGNGSADGPFVYCGFRPRYVMVKRTDTTSNWVIIDTTRDAYNAGGLYLYPNLSAAEDDYRASAGPIDVLSNGFKPRSALSNVNASGGTYIFMAFAETPFKNSLAR